MSLEELQMLQNDLARDCWHLDDLIVLCRAGRYLLQTVGHLRQTVNFKSHVIT